MTESAATPEQLDLDKARRGLRSCLTCRTAFPNALALAKHQVQGCSKVKRTRV